VKPSFLITVDTELSNFPDGQGLWGRIGDQSWGLARMLDDFDSMGVVGTFFLDVYAKSDRDVAEQRRAAELIFSRGHDLQLHTHPAPAFDPARPRLRDYTLAEQCDIIEFGCQRIQDWTGHRPTLHRAGDWGADSNSLQALKRQGMRADFSASPWSPNCGIDPEAIRCNGWLRIDDMLCGLGSCYRDRLTGRVRRVDIGGTSFREVLDVLAIRTDPFILTLHSFSLMRFDRSRTRFQGDPLYVERLRETCRLARDVHGYQLLTASQAVAQIESRPGEALHSTPLPRTNYIASTAGILKSIRVRLAAATT
jgi:hypothetical protein